MSNRPLPPDHGLLPPAEAEPDIFYPFAERLFIAALRHGWTWLAANAWAWERVFRFIDVLERATVAKYLTEAARTPRIVQGYPAASSTVPQIAVVIEDERPHPGGDVLADVLEPWGSGGYSPDGHPIEIGGEIRLQTVTVTAHADHPDVVLYLYRFADIVLISHGDWFARQGLIDPAFASGGPLTPDPRAPDRLWFRQLRWTVGGISGAPIAIPPPPTSLVVALEGETDAGRAGRVTIRR